MLGASVINGISVVVITLIMSYFSLVFGELVPKKIGMQKPEAISFKVVGILLFISKFFSPVVKVLSPANPVVLIENCGVLTTGKTILEAFDRLEVSEFTAKCIIMASRLGELSPINDQQVSDIIDAFKLPIA